MAANKPDAPQNGNENRLSICNPSGFHGKVGTSETVEAINEIYSDDYCLDFRHSQLGCGPCLSDRSYFLVCRLVERTCQKRRSDDHAPELGQHIGE